jgi:hypothetical protein
MRREDWRDQIIELARYALNSILVLCFKLSLMWLVIKVFDAFVAYALVHAVVVVFAYVIHARMSFAAQLSLGGFVAYLRAVFLFKALDYAVFSFAFARLDFDVPWAIMLATVSIAGLRFLTVRRLFASREARSE